MKLCYYTKIQAHDSTKENVDDPEAEVALNVDNDEKEEKVCQNLQPRENHTFRKSLKSVTTVLKSP